jgi:hypothetical protein
VPTLHSSKATPSAVNASSSRTNFTAANVNNSAITQEWRSTSTGATTLDLIFASNPTLTSLLLQEANFSSATIFTSADGITFPTNAGTLTTYPDKKIPNRRRGIFAINAAVKGVRISIPFGTPTDGLGYWRVGAAYPFRVATNIPKQANINSTVKAQRPLVINDPSNGNRAVARAGRQYNELTLGYNPVNVDNFSSIIGFLQDGVCGLDFQLPVLPGMIFPVSIKENSIDESLSQLDRSDMQLVLTEIVGG